MKKTMKLFAVSAAMLFALLFAACQNDSSGAAGSDINTGSPAEYTSTYQNSSNKTETTTVSFASGIWVSRSSGEGYTDLQTGYGTYAGDASVDGTIRGTITKFWNEQTQSLEDVNPPRKLVLTITGGKFDLDGITYTRK